MGASHSRAQVRHVAVAEPTHVTASLLASRLPQPVGREVVLPIRGGAEVAGGLVAGDLSTESAYRFDVASGAVRRRSSLAVAVHDAAGAVLRRTPMVIGGGNAAEQATVQRLGPSGRWRVVGRLPQPRSDLASVAVDGRLVVLGGYDGAMSPAAILVSREGGHFRTVGKLPLPVRYAAVVVYRGAIWLFGGEHDGHLVSTVQRVSIRSWRSAIVGHLSRPVSDAAGMVLGGRITLAGGRTSATALTGRICRWNVRQGSCDTVGRLPYPLADTGVLPAGDTAYLLGGETPSLTDRVVRLSVP